MFAPSTSTRRWFAILIAIVSAGTVAQWTQAPGNPGTSAEVLEEGNGRRWYRGNLHTHTHWSDGDDYPEMIALWYREHGYQFVAMTDHNVMQVGNRWVDLNKTKGGEVALKKLRERFPGDWVEIRERDGRTEIRLKTLPEIASRVDIGGDFLLLHGEEISDHFMKHPIHMNVTNLEQVILPQGGNSVLDVMQANIDAVNDQRERTGRPMMIHLNHPNFFYAVRAEDLMRIRGTKFFEVYNGHPEVHNSGTRVLPGTERLWDISLAKRLSDLRLPLLYGLAVDDGHSYHKIPSRASEPGRGWVMVLSDQLTPDSIVAAMERGHFYSSTGVRLKKISATERKLTVVIDPDPDVTYQIDFITTHAGFDRIVTPPPEFNGQPIHASGKYSADIGVTVKTVNGLEGEYSLADDDLYIRAVVTSSRKHPNPSEPGEFERAWVQPILGPAANKPE